MEQEKIEREFKVSDPAKLKVTNVRGSVHIEPGDMGTIHINAVKHLNSGDAEGTSVEIFQDEDGLVNAIVPDEEQDIPILIGRNPVFDEFQVIFEEFNKTIHLIPKEKPLKF